MNIVFPIIIKNNSFKNFKIENNFNYKKDFIDWYSSINTDFLIEQKNESSLNKYFKNYKKNIEIINLPDITIKDIKSFENLIITKHGRFREEFIDLLKSQFQINYWDELFKIISKNDFPIHQINYTEILGYCVKNGYLIIEKKEEIVSIINNLLRLVKENKIKYTSDILEFVGNLIFFKGDYENSWIIESLDNLIINSEKNDTKMFTFQLDKISKHLHNLDFENVKISKEFKHILKGNLSIKRTPEVCYPFYFEVNTQKYTQQNNIVFQIFLSNTILVMTLLKNYLEQDSDVIVHELKIEKSIVKLSAITENLRINQRLDYFINLLLEKSKENCVIDKSSFEKDMINYFLKEDMKTNIKNEKLKKI